MALAAVIAALSLESAPAAGQAPVAGGQAPGDQNPAPPTSWGGCPAQPLAFHTCALEKAKTFNPRRTPDGKPDMQGYWRDRLTSGFAVEGIEASDPDSRNLVQAATVGPGMIVDPPDGKIPYQPWAAAIGRKGLNLKKYIDPHGRCGLHGPPRNVEVSPIYQLL